MVEGDNEMLVGCDAVGINFFTSWQEREEEAYFIPRTSYAVHLSERSLCVMKQGFPTVRRAVLSQRPPCGWKK
jgi:predicted  nucleic acid-binding Zn-ribbon protein